MSKLLACCAVIVSLAAAPVTATGTRLTRVRAQELARRQNPRLAASRAAQAEAQARKGQADAARWPMLELEVGSGPAEKAALAPGTAVGSTRSAYDFSWSDFSWFIGGQARLVQPIYTFGKIDLRRAAAAHGVEAAAARTRMTQAEVALEVARLYETFLFARDSELVCLEALRIADNSIEQTRERREARSSNFRETDLLRLRVARSSAELGLTQSRAAMAQTRAGLSAWLGLPPGESLSFAEPGLEPVSRPSPRLDALIEQGLRERPEPRALREGEAAYSSLARAERAGYLPDFFALGQITAAYTPGRDLVTSRYYVDPLYSFVPAALVGFRWALQANLPGQRAGQMRAKANRLRALWQWAQLGIPAEVRVAHQDALRAQRDLDETSSALPLAKQWMVRTSADYAAGLGDSRDLTDAVSAYVRVRTARMDAVLRLNLALAKLGQATGTLAEGGGPYPGPPAGLAP